MSDAQERKAVRERARANGHQERDAITPEYDTLSGMFHIIRRTGHVADGEEVHGAPEQDIEFLVYHIEEDTTFLARCDPDYEYTSSPDNVVGGNFVRGTIQAIPGADKTLWKFTELWVRRQTTLTLMQTDHEDASFANTDEMWANRARGDDRVTDTWWPDEPNKIGMHVLAYEPDQDDQFRDFLTGRQVPSVFFARYEPPVFEPSGDVFEPSDSPNHVVVLDNVTRDYMAVYQFPSANRQWGWLVEQLHSLAGV